MRLVISLALFSLLAAGCRSKGSYTLPLFSNDTSVNAKYRFSPTVDQSSFTNVYIPPDLDSGFVELDRMLTPAFREEIKAVPAPDVHKYRGQLGLWVKNKWGLWSDSRLRGWFQGQGLTHPDDMSACVLDAYWCHLQGSQPDLPALLKYYQSKRRLVDSLSRRAADIQQMPELPRPFSFCR
jgi:hypothetical protein